MSLAGERSYEFHLGDRSKNRRRLLAVMFLVIAAPGLYSTIMLGTRESSERPGQFIVLICSNAIALLCAVMMVALARRRTTVDSDGVTARGVWTSRRLGWSDIDGIGLDQSAMSWTLVARSQGADVVIFRCGLRESVVPPLIHGEVHRGGDCAPPDWAPGELRHAFDAVTRIWRLETGRAAEDPAVPEPGETSPSHREASESPPSATHRLRSWRRLGSMLAWQLGFTVLLTIGIVAVIPMTTDNWGYLAIYPTLGGVVMVVTVLVYFREGTLLEPDGIVPGGFAEPHRIGWNDIDGVEVEHDWGQWFIRVWDDTTSTVIYHLPPLSPFGRSRSALRQPNRLYGEPPDDAPAPLHRAFQRIVDYRHHYGRETVAAS